MAHYRLVLIAASKKRFQSAHWKNIAWVQQKDNMRFILGCKIALSVCVDFKIFYSKKAIHIVAGYILK